VTKRHRPDKFLLTHAVDVLLALDFKVRRRDEMSKMLQEFDQCTRAGGRSTLRRQRTSPELRVHF